VVGKQATSVTAPAPYCETVPRRALSPVEADSRRQALLDAAVHVFNQEGQDATVAVIARTAGVAKGSFYTYFDSKEDLVVALRQRYISLQVENATAIFERVGSEDLLELADEMVATFVDLAIEQRDVIKLIRWGSGGDATIELAEANRRVQEIVDAGIRVGVAAGLFEVDDPWLTAGLVNHAIHGYVEEMILRDEDLDPQAVITASQTLVRRALLKPA
jgi:AcrR family transcriptional regulator